LISGSSEKSLRTQTGSSKIDILEMSTESSVQMAFILENLDQSSARRPNVFLFVE